MATHSSILAWKFRGQTSLVGYSPWGGKELDVTEWMSTRYQVPFLWGPTVLLSQFQKMVFFISCTVYFSSAVGNRDTKANETWSLPTRDLKLIKVLLKQKYYWKQWHIKLPSIPSCCRLSSLVFMSLKTTTTTYLLDTEIIFSGSCLPAVGGL